MINVEKIDDVLIVSFATDNKLNVAISQKFKQDVTSLINQTGVKLVINLSGVEYVDSSGFGSLLSILRATKNQNGQLKFCNFTSDVMELVKLLQLQSVFDIRDSVDDCLKSFY